MAYFSEVNIGVRDAWLLLPQAEVARSEDESDWGSIILLMRFGKGHKLVQTATAGCHSWSVEKFGGDKRLQLRVVTNTSELKLHFLPVVAVSQDNLVGGVSARLNSPVFPELRFKVNLYTAQGLCFWCWGGADEVLKNCAILFVFCLSRVGQRQFPSLKLFLRCKKKAPQGLIMFLCDFQNKNGSVRHAQRGARNHTSRWSKYLSVK